MFRLVFIRCVVVICSFVGLIFLVGFWMWVLWVVGGC